MPRRTLSHHRGSGASALSEVAFTPLLFIGLLANGAHSSTYRNTTTGPPSRSDDSRDPRILSQHEAKWENRTARSVGDPERDA